MLSPDCSVYGDSLCELNKFSFSSCKKKVENLSLNVDENDEVLYKVKVKCFVLGTKVKIGKKDASFTL